MGILWDQRSFRGQIEFLAKTQILGPVKTQDMEIGFFWHLTRGFEGANVQKQSPYDTTMVGRDVIIVVTVVIKIVKHILIQ